MPLLTLSQISKAYGVDQILDAISLQIQPGEKVGLIGPNGSGKTTLLKIIANELEADGGELHLSRGATVGYLSQEPPALPEKTLRRHLEHPLRGILDLRAEIATLEKEIAASASEGSDHDSWQQKLDHYATLTARFEERGGYQVESKLNGVARGLGFSEADFARPIQTFSGGEKTRARLAGLLLQDLDLLLLDEPTNFLDLQALEWLEKFLRDYSGALLVVSHDRFFLDRVAGQIFALQGHRLKAYRGNYSAYQEQLVLETEANQKAVQHQQLLLAREERLVREAKADERSKRQARSRQKRLDKLDQVEQIGPSAGFKLGLDYSGRSGRQVISFDAVTTVFAEQTIFKDLNFEISWGDRVALIGPNGAGKSTLLKLIAATLQPTSGQIRLGPAVRVLYFDQEQQQLIPHQTLLETITATTDLDQKAARNHLGRYLFRGDDVFKRVDDLSGGEKSRLALARLALGSGNCLLMDEPTSHLDLPALEELERVLSDFPGTLIIVSHDRYFLKGLANRVFELDQGRLTVYNRTFSEYLDLKSSGENGAKSGKEPKDEEKRKRQVEHQRRQKSERALRRLKNEQSALEETIGNLEEKIAAIETTLSDPATYGDHAQLSALGAALESDRTALAALLEQWEAITGRLED